MNLYEQLGFDKPVNENLRFDFTQSLNSPNLTVVPIGELYLPSGRIVASDPFFLAGDKPFTGEVKPGKYPVELVVATVEPDHHRVAFARLKFSDSPATKWTMALNEGLTEDQIRELKPGQIFGFGVDAGLGCYIDPATIEIFNSVMDKSFNANGDYYTDVLASEFKEVSAKHPLSHSEGIWNVHHPVKGDERNVVMFHSGWGDGFYATYWGADNKGNVVELITDFGVVGGEEGNE